VHLTITGALDTRGHRSRASPSSGASSASSSAGWPLPSDHGSPPATNVLLVATLVVTIAAVAEFLRRTEGGGDVSAETTGAFLALFTVLFAMRVAGQLVVRYAAPRWLPPMDRWNLMPYRLLLPIRSSCLR
jgi:hypothetical protein